MSTDNGVDAHRPILCMPIRNNKFEIIGKLLNNMFSTWGDVQAHNLINYISSPLLLPPPPAPPASSNTLNIHGGLEVLKENYMWIVN